jgi:hypothetical protein
MASVLKSDRIGFLCCRNFIYGGEQYSIGDEFEGSSANNIETLVRARYVIPVVDKLEDKPRHWHLHVHLREETEKKLRDGPPVQIVFAEPEDEVNLTQLIDPNRPDDHEGEPNPLPGPPEGWDNEDREPVEEDVVAPPPEEAEEPEPEPAPEPAPEPEPEPESAAEVVPEGTIAEVKAWVGDNEDRALEALEAEEAGQNRSTLIAWLEDQLR